MGGSSDRVWVLAGDVGGTKTNLGLFSARGARPVPRIVERYSSREASNLESIVADFLARNRVAVAGACFGIAGPVFNGRCRATNLPWTVSEAQLARRFSWRRVRLVNDLTATAMSIPLLRGRDICALNRVKGRQHQSMALLAPGTGLGAALLFSSDRRYYPVPSEGGHTDWAPNSVEEVDLWLYLHKQFGHVSAERLLSGAGQIHIYRWLKDSGRYQESRQVAGWMQEMDPARAINLGATQAKNPLCIAAMKRFASILGAAAGNLGLMGMALGGVYLGGGIPPKMLPFLTDGVFMDAFVGKGRFRELMQSLPVRVVLNDQAALLGAAQCARDLLR